MKLTGLQKTEAGVIISSSIQNIETLKAFKLNAKTVAEKAIRQAVKNCAQSIDNLLIENVATILYATGTFSYSSGHSLEEVYKVIAVVFNSLTEKDYTNKQAFKAVEDYLNLEPYQALEAQAAAVLHNSSTEPKSLYSAIEQNKLLSRFVKNEILETLIADYTEVDLPF